MKQYSLLIVLFCLLFTLSCKKDELPESQIGKPEFSSQFSFSGDQYNLVTGENGLVQTSSYDTSGMAIVLNSYTGPANCNDCGPAYTLTIQSPSDFVYSDGMNMIAPLNNWDYALTVDSVASLLKMEGLLVGGNTQGDWFLNGAPIQPVGDTIKLEISEPGNYTLTYAVNEDSCAASTTRNFDFDGITAPCFGNIIQSFSSPSSPTTYYAYPGFPFVPEEMSYIWTYADTTIATGTVDSFDVPVQNSGGEVCVEMINAQGCSATACYATPETSSNGSQCSADLFMQSAQIVEVLPLDFAAYLILEFTDEGGITYKSDGGSQNSSTLSIISINAYTEPTMPEKRFAKMAISLSCTLYDETGNGYPFSGTLQTAFEYP